MEKNKEYIENIKLYEESGIDEQYNETPYNFFITNQPIFTKKVQPKTTNQTLNISIIKAREETEKLANESNNISELQEKIKNFTLNPLSKFATNAITGTGIQSPTLLVITEMPNTEEDRTGIALSGETGELLKKILSAIKCSTETNTFTFPASPLRPAGARTPTQEEMEISKPFIKKYIELLNPQLILTMGTIPTQILLEKEEAITSLRGKFFEYKSIPLIATFSLNYLLNNKEAKKKTWEDLQLLIPKIEEIK